MFVSAARDRQVGGVWGGKVTRRASCIAVRTTPYGFFTSTESRRRLRYSGRHRTDGAQVR
jgi:hypothetical protein